MPEHLNARFIRYMLMLLGAALVLFLALTLYSEGVQKRSADTAAEKAG